MVAVKLIMVKLITIKLEIIKIHLVEEIDSRMLELATIKWVKVMVEQAVMDLQKYLIIQFLIW